MARVATFLGLVVLSMGCGGGAGAVVDGGPPLETAALVVAAGAEGLEPHANDTVSGTLDLGRLGLAKVDEVYELTTPAGAPFVFDILSRADSNTGPVRISICHASDGGATPVGGPGSLVFAGMISNATGMTLRGVWVDSNGDGFARFTVRGEIDRDQVLACEVDDGARKATALVRIRIGPASKINLAAGFSGDHPGVISEETLYSSDSWHFGLPTIAVSGDRTSIVVYEGDRSDRFKPVRFELRMQHDAATGAVTGGGSEETNIDWGNWRDHEIAALFNVLARVHSGTEQVTLKLSFDRGATFGQTEVLGGGPQHPWSARLATIAMAADYTLAVLFWQSHAGGGTDLILVEGRPSAFDGTGSPTRYAFDAPRVLRPVAGDVSPIVFSAKYSTGGDLVVGYAFSTMVRNEFRGVTTTTEFRCAVRRFGETGFFDELIEVDRIVGKDPSIALSGAGANLRILYAYEGRDGIVLRESRDAGVTWSASIPIGERTAHLPTVLVRGNTVDVLYLTHARNGLELHVQHWDDFDTSLPERFRLTEATFEELPPRPGPGIATTFAPGPGRRVTEVSWFGYDALVDGDDIVVVYDEHTYDGYMDILPLGLPIGAAPGTVAEDSEFRAADPPPLAPGMTEPLPAPDPTQAHQLRLLRMR